MHYCTLSWFYLRGGRNSCATKITQVLLLRSITDSVVVTVRKSVAGPGPYRPIISFRRCFHLHFSEPDDCDVISRMSPSASWVGGHDSAMWLTTPISPPLLLCRLAAHCPCPVWNQFCMASQMAREVSAQRSSDWPRKLTAKAFIYSIVTAVIVVPLKT